MNIDMDSFVNKLRNTVSQVACQVNTSVNTIIPGNIIHRKYETLKLRCNHGCPGLVWSIYDSVERDSASMSVSLKDAISPNLVPNQDIGQKDNELENYEKKLYSVFVFDKSQIDKLPRSVRETALDHIKKGVTQLTRIRHPSVLTVRHPLEESRSSLAFVTEHVYGHLESILREQRYQRVDKSNKVTNIDLVDLAQDLGPKDSDYQQNSCQLDEIQIKAGLLQVCDGLKFLYNDAKILHRNLCLDNIFVDSNNTWKIAGFDFSVHQNNQQILGSGNNSQQQTNVSMDIIEFTPKAINSPLLPSLRATCHTLPSSIVPNWSCSAPEHSNNDQVTYSSDIYSLGIISCALLGKDFDMVDLSYEYGLISDTYKRGIRLRELADRLPASSKSTIMKYAAINAESRPCLDDYQNLAIFNDQQVQAIRDLDSQLAWDRIKKIDFFNRLRDILPRLSHQIRVNRIAKSLFNEFVNSDMLPHILPNILIIAKDTTPTEFKTKIFPQLKNSFRILEPKVVPNMLLDNLLILADRAKLCLPEFQQSAFTLIQYLLRMDQQMQEKCMIVIPTVKRFIDENSLNTLLLPELARLHNETTIQSIRVQTFDCIGSMIDIMSERSILNHVLPILLQTPSREANVIMAATSVIKSITNHSRVSLTKEILAVKILPFLIPLCVEKDLDLQQFNTMIMLIKNTMDRIEREQREILAKRSRVTTQKSSALVLDNLKGSNHFQLD